MADRSDRGPGGHYIDDKVSSNHQAQRFAESMIDLDLDRLGFGSWAILDKETGMIHGWTGLAKLRPWWGPGDEIALSYVLRRASWERDWRRKLPAISYIALLKTSGWRESWPWLPSATRHRNEYWKRSECMQLKARNHSAQTGSSISGSMRRLP